MLTASHDDHQPEGTDALIAALVQIEHHVTAQGWDQPARLFALVRTDELIRNEPSLAAHMKVSHDDALSSIEQEDFHMGVDLTRTLSGIAWPASVTGCAIAMERNLLPPEFEDEIPDDPAAAEQFVATHPKHLEMRIVVGALRDGSRYGIGRLVTHPDDLLGGVAFAPNLTDLVAGTLR